MVSDVLQAWVAMGGNAGAAEKLRQQAAWQKQTLNPRDSAASASQVRSRTAASMPYLCNEDKGSHL